MNEKEVERLYEGLSDLYGVPMPIYLIYDRRPEIVMPRDILSMCPIKLLGPQDRGIWSSTSRLSRSSSVGRAAALCPRHRNRVY